MLLLRGVYTSVGICTLLHAIMLYVHVRCKVPEIKTLRLFRATTSRSSLSVPQLLNVDAYGSLIADVHPGIRFRTFLFRMLLLHRVSVLRLRVNVSE